MANASAAPLSIIKEGAFGGAPQPFERLLPFLIYCTTRVHVFGKQLASVVQASEAGKGRLLHNERCNHCFYIIAGKFKVYLKTLVEMQNAPQQVLDLYAARI